MGFLKLHSFLKRPLTSSIPAPGALAVWTVLLKGKVLLNVESGEQGRGPAPETAGSRTAGVVEGNKSLGADDLTKSDKAAPLTKQCR